MSLGRTQSDVSRRTHSVGASPWRMSSIISYGSFLHRFVMWIGLSLTILSAGYLIVLTIQYVGGYRDLVNGQLLLLGITVLMSGVLLMTVGVLTAYTFRIFQEVLARAALPRRPRVRPRIAPRPMRLAVLQSNYIPWKGYFDLMAMADLFIVYDSVQYTKNDWRNRNILPTPSGPTWLTIPVVTAGRSDQRIHDAVIGDRRWARKHWQTVSQLLARRPSFASYRDVWESWWQEAESFELLHDVNVHFLRGLAGQLGVAAPIVDDRQYRLAEDTPTGKLVQLCQAVRADRYATGPSGLNYLELHRFDVAGYRSRRHRLQRLSDVSTNHERVPARSQRHRSPGFGGLVSPGSPARPLPHRLDVRRVALRHTKWSLRWRAESRLAWESHRNRGQPNAAHLL